MCLGDTAIRDRDKSGPPCLTAGNGGRRLVTDGASAQYRSSGQVAGQDSLVVDLYRLLYHEIDGAGAGPKRPWSWPRMNALSLQLSLAPKMA